MKRTNDILETIKYLKEQETLNREKRAAEIAEYKAQLESKELDNFVIRADRERQERMRSKVLEGARNAALSTALKAIYITALEQHTLTDDGILLAESMVDTWIKENGGASTILAKHKNESYLLSRLAQIVEDAAEKEVEDIEKDDDTEEVESDDTSKDSALDAAKEFISNADKKELKDFVDQIKKTADDRKDNIKDEAEAEKADKDAEKAHDKLDKSNEKLGKESDNTEDEDIDDDSEDSEDSEDTDDSKEDEDTDDVDFSDNDEKSDDTVNEIEKEKSEDDETEEEKKDDPLADDLDEDDDGIDHSIDDEDSDDDEDDDDESDDDDSEEEDDDEDITIDGEEEDDSEDKDSNGTVLDELDKEDDVKKAIEIIRNRVADAEKTFIKNNAEDKKKIEELLDKISNNVKKVEDTKDNENSTETEIAKEAVMVTKRKISEISNNRPLTIMEAMARKFEKSVLTNESVRKMYSDEDNKVDTGLAMESAKIMYGFLETLNTLNLENVDESYIQKVLESM